MAGSGFPNVRALFCACGPKPSVAPLVPLAKTGFLSRFLWPKHGSGVPRACITLTCAPAHQLARSALLPGSLAQSQRANTRSHPTFATTSVRRIAGRRAWQIVFALVGLVVAMVYGCALLRRAVQRHVRYIWMRGKAQEVIVVDLRDRVGFETA